MFIVKNFHFYFSKLKYTPFGHEFALQSFRLRIEWEQTIDKKKKTCSEGTPEYVGRSGNTVKFQPD